MVLQREKDKSTGNVRNNIEYYEIGEIQLNCAIEMYNKDNFICAITLAGAAEEILGKLVKEYNGQKNALDTLKENFQIKYPKLETEKWDLNSVRNPMKHVCEDICNQDFDIKNSAIYMISRGVMNYFLYTDKLTNLMVAFYNNDVKNLVDSPCETKKITNE